MFLHMLQGCWESGFSPEDQSGQTPEEQPIKSDAAPAKDEAGEVVVVQTEGPGAHECFILERRECYWSVLGAVKVA